MKSLITLLSLAALPLGAFAQTTFTSDDDHFAWCANIGWVDFRPERPAATNGVRVTDTHLSGFAWNANTGWINFGNGSPADGVRYLNTINSDFGVNQDGAGNLSGLAWSANLGWINFGWASANDASRPRFSIYSGEFIGFAWSANAGWLNLGTGILRTDSIAITDTDGDGIADWWEIQYAGDLETMNATTDFDGDGVKDKQEYIADTSPLAPGGGLKIVHVAHDAALHHSEVEWTSRPTRLYTLWESTNLTSNVWTPLGTLPGAPGATSSALAPANQSATFYRIEVKLPLTP
jgi:hypothetical protein